MKRLAPLTLALLPAAAAADTPALEAAALRFFEQADGPVLPVARRLYTTRFDAVRTRRLGVVFSADYAPPNADATVALDCRLERPGGGTTPAERPMEFRLFAGRTTSESANLLWGGGAERGWAPGSYAVECRTAGGTVARAAFEVRLNPPDVEDGAIRVEGIRLFAVDEQIPPIGDRAYALAFPAAGTRRIGVEIGLAHAPLGRSAQVPVDCWFFWPGGETSPPLVLNYAPEPAWAGGFSAGAMGFAEPGRWAPGAYTVSCAIDGRPVAVERFVVE